MQASMYARSASAAGRASGDGSWHYDARFPGKKVITRKGGKR